MTTFIGIDLAWTASRPSGVCVLADDGPDIRLVALYSRVITPADVVALATASDDVTLAIDAPLLVGPDRSAERELYREYGKYEAGAFLATESFLASFNAMAGPDTGKALRRKRVSLDPARCGTCCRLAIEVYPHAAHIALFDIAKTIRYKKGRIEARRDGLRVYQALLGEAVTLRMPSVAADLGVACLLSTEPASKRGRDLKALEDMLDALTCACVAFIARTGGPDAIDVFGALPLEGHIVVPRRRPMSGYIRSGASMPINASTRANEI